MDVFLFLIGLTAASIYLLKHPDLLTMLSHKKKISPSPIMKGKNISINLYFGDSNSDYLMPGATKNSPARGSNKK